MTTEIYSLYWEEQDLTYIGQSQNIETRFKEHLLKAHKGVHTNYKVQNVYNLYGPPLLFILEVCNIDKCNDLEISWTKEFNSLNSKQGLNIIEAGQVGWGTNSNNSTYSRNKILKVFSMLYKTNLMHKDIAKRLDISIDTVDDIKQSASHLWLKEAYPCQYVKMRNRKINRHDYMNRYGRSAKLVSPNGGLFEIVNIPEFCRTQISFIDKISSAETNIRRVLDGTRSQYKGWKLA